MEGSIEDDNLVEETWENWHETGGGEGPAFLRGKYSRWELVLAKKSNGITCHSDQMLGEAVPIGLEAGRCRRAGRWRLGTRPRSPTWADDPVLDATRHH